MLPFQTCAQKGPLCCLTLSLLFLCSVFKVQFQLRFEVRHENSKSLLSFHVQRQSLSLVGLSGLEPPTLRLSVVRSSQLSYKPSLMQTSLRSLSAPPKAHNVPSLLLFKSTYYVELTSTPCCFTAAGKLRLFSGFASFGSAGGDSRDRTGDLLLARQALSQLSYIPFSTPEMHRFGVCPLN